MRWLSALWRRPRHEAVGPLETLDHGGFIAIDLETTGLDRRRDRIVALAAVRFVGGEATPALVTLVNPGRAIPPSSTAIHGIDDAMVVDAPAEAPAVRRLDELCAGQVIVGHDLAFDLAILRRARQGVDAAPPPLAMLCTKRLAASLQPPWRHATLEALCAAFGVSIEGRHTAEGDAVTAGRLLLALLPRIRARGIRTLGELLWLQETADG